MEQFNQSFHFSKSLSTSSANQLTFFVDDPCGNAPNAVNVVNTELIQYISNACVAAGYSSLIDVAKAFGTKNPDKIVRNLRIFWETGKLNSLYMNHLHTLLHIDRVTTDEIRKRHNERLFADRRIFIDNFELLFQNTDVILANPVYRNIQFYGLAIQSAWVSRNRPLTLGELFFHYRRNEWITRDCCGPVYIFSASGSALSGCHRYHGCCTGCKKEVQGSCSTFSEILNPFFQSPPDFDYEPAEYSVSTLIESLRITNV